jgi:hypothetical protein
MIESKGLTSAASDLSPLIVSASGSRSLLTPTSVPRTTNGSNSVSATSWASASLADPWAKDSRGQRWRSRHLRKRYRCLVGRQWFAPLKCRRTRSNRCGVDFTRIYQFAFSSWFWFIPELRDDRQRLGAGCIGDVGWIGDLAHSWTAASGTWYRHLVDCTRRLNDGVSLKRRLQIWEIGQQSCWSWNTGIAIQELTDGISTIGVGSGQRDTSATTAIIECRTHKGPLVADVVLARGKDSVSCRGFCLFHWF